MLDKFIHQTLGLPYHLFVSHDRRVKNEVATIVFWHGIATTSRAWNKTIAKLSDDHVFDNVRIIAVDLLGFGKSPKPDWLDYTTNDYLRSLRRTLNKLHIKTPLILVGHSMGALLAVEYTTAYPGNIVALALTSPPFLQPTESKALFDRLYRKIYDKLLTATQIKQLDLTAKMFEKLTYLESNETKSKSFELSMRNVIIASDAFSKINKLSLPIYIFHGTLDLLVNSSNYRPLAKKSNITIQNSVTYHEVIGPMEKQLIKTLTELVEKFSVKT